MVETISPSRPLHGIHGALGGKYLRYYPAHRQTGARRCHQLGSSRGQDADILPVGILAASVREAAATSLVPRSLSPGWNAVSPGGGGSDQAADQRELKRNRRPHPLRYSKSENSCGQSE